MKPKLLQLLQRIKFRLRFWMLQLPVMALFVTALTVFQKGESGELQPGLLREQVYPALRALHGSFTNFKFRYRGTQKPKNKIVIVAVDGASINFFGRWPWTRNNQVYLLQQIMKYEPKVVGIDAVYDQEEGRIPQAVKLELDQRSLSHLYQDYDGDPNLELTFAEYSDRIVVGWTSDDLCIPAFDQEGRCRFRDPARIKSRPQFFDHFAVSHVEKEPGFHYSKTPLPTVVEPVANMARFNRVLKHSGIFNVDPDPDGYVRRSRLIYFESGMPFPSLPLEMARVGMDDDLSIRMGADHKVKKLSFKKSGLEIPVNPLAELEMNFRGPQTTFRTIPAMYFLEEDKDFKFFQYRTPALAKRSDLAEMIKDAYVLIGVTALGVYDIRAMPFDHLTPGVEGLATILDNVLSQDALLGTWYANGYWTVMLVMILGGILIAYFKEHHRSLPSFAFFLGFSLILALVDLELLFPAGLNWNTSLLYAEFAMVFVFSLMARFMVEERDKKFIREAFARYVAPEVVDSIIVDPKKLALGGEKKVLSIMFTDVRGFTSFSENMDPHKLTEFLNEYLGHMTEIILANHGTLDKYNGDGIMCFWGAPLDRSDHAFNACMTALAMIGTVEQHQYRYRDKYGVDVSIGVGINSGLVTVGNLGSERNFDYTVIGDHVNLASRLEGLTKVYNVPILCSRHTLQEIESSGLFCPPHRVLDQVRVKGKAKSIELVQIIDRDYPKDALDLFAKGRELYLKRQWAEAIQAFEEAQRQFSRETAVNDGPTRILLKRCKEFMQNPPPDDWNGDWIMEQK